MRATETPFVPKTLDYWQVLEPLLRELSAETAKSGAAQKGTAAQTDSDVGSAFAPKTLLVKNSAEVERKQIVIADDDQDMLQLLSERFSSCGHSVVGVDNALDAINMIHHVSPDLVCIDIGMPSGNGLSVCEMMASDEELRKIPIIVLTGRSDGETIRRCHDLLVYYVQKSGDTWDRVAPLAKELLTGTKAPRGPAESTDHSPADTSTKEEKTSEPDNLMDAVFAALASAGDDEGQKDGFGDPSAVTVVQKDVPWILCIDDDADFSDALRIRLENHGVAVVRAFNGMDGYRLAFTSPANAILLDYHMPNGEGDYILGRLKDNPVTKNIPVFMITGNQDRVLQRRMLAMGAADFLVKPLDFDDLRERLAKYIDILALQRGRQLAHAGKGVT